MFLHLSVILFTRGSHCPNSYHRSHDHGVSVQGDLCSGEGGLCLVGSLSRGWVSVQGVGLCSGGGSLFRGWVSVQGVSVWGHRCLGRSLSRGSLVSGTPQTETPPCGNERAVGILLECILVTKFKSNVKNCSCW